LPDEGRSRAKAKSLDSKIENFLNAESKYQDLNENNEVFVMDEEWGHQPVRNLEDQHFAKRTYESEISAALESINALLNSVGIAYTQVKSNTAGHDGASGSKGRPRGRYYEHLDMSG
jgi:hypothetical protein